MSTRAPMRRMTPTWIRQAPFTPGSFATSTSTTPHGGEGSRTAAGASLEGGARTRFHEQLAALRPDAAARLIEADARHRANGEVGPPPSARCDEAVRALERAGLGGPGRAAIEALFQPARGQSEVSATRVRDALRRLERLKDLVSIRPTLTNRPAELRQLCESVLAFAREVVAAYRNNRTVDGSNTEGAEARGAEELRRMNDAFVAYERSATDDPIERLMTVLELQDQVSRAARLLQSFGSRFRSTVTVGDASPSELVRGIQEHPIAVAAEGLVGESLGRDLPTVSLERYILTPRELGELPTRPPRLGAALAKLLRGYQRAHLIGPGFGGELFEGIMLAPPQMNQEAQNKGVERFIRAAAEHGIEITLSAQATGRRLLVPLADGTVEHVDILERVSYQITGSARESSREVSHEVVIEVSAPPNGTPRLIRSTLPDNAPGTDELAKLARAGTRTGRRK
jgi:Bacterial toxin 4